MEEKKCKVLVVGGGPGGYSSAIRAGQLGLDTIIVEKEKFGGTCLNVGCIPTKAYVHLANIIGEVNKGAEVGITAHVDSMDLNIFQQKKNANISRLVSGVEFLLKSAKVQIVRGTASFIDKNSVKVVTDKGETLKITGENIIMAMGSRPKLLKGMEFDHEMILSSTDAINLTEIPKRLGIVGAGVVGMELASVFSRLGAKVTVVEMLERILPLEDKSAADFLQKAMQKDGVDFFVSSGLSEIKRTGGELELTIKKGSDTSKVTVDKLIVAAGRDLNLDNIGIENTGVKIERGRIIVDDHMKTSVDNIYAVGDIVPSIQLAHAAYEEGAVAAENIAGNQKSVDYSAIPRCTYTMPEICGVGLTEEEAKKAYPKCKSSRVALTSIGKAVIEGKGDGFIKIISEPEYGEILGCVIAGQGISELISIPTTAMAMEGTIDALADTVIAHPSLSEAVKEVALLAAGRPLHVK